MVLCGFDFGWLVGFFFICWGLLLTETKKSNLFFLNLNWFRKSFPPGKWSSGAAPAGDTTGGLKHPKKLKQNQKPKYHRFGDLIWNMEHPNDVTISYRDSIYHKQTVNYFGVEFRFSTFNQKDVLSVATNVI